MITYYPLWVTLAKKKLKKKDLYPIISSATVARMGRDEYVSLEVIDRLCEFLDCSMSDVVIRNHMEDPENEKSPDS